jgi:hypothetical protein
MKTRSVEHYNRDQAHESAIPVFVSEYDYCLLIEQANNEIRDAYRSGWTAGAEKMRETLVNATMPDVIVSNGIKYFPLPPPEEPEQ